MKSKTCVTISFFALIFSLFILSPIQMNEAKNPFHLLPTNDMSYLNSNRPLLHSHSYIEAESFGNQEEFWIYDFTTNTRNQMLSTLLAVGSICYIYMGNATIDDMGLSEAISMCETYKDEFDSVIYPKAVEFAGHPDGILGDIDGDPHITILLYDFPSVTGYYYAPNDDPSYPYSNHREMIYMDTKIGILEGFKTLAHEFNHLIFANNDLEDASFFAEGIAEYSIFYTSYLSNSTFLLNGQGINQTDFTEYFKYNTKNSLLCWDPNLPYLIENYGSAYLFIFYLAEKYGTDVIQQFIFDEDDGIESLESILEAKGFNVSFNEIFMNWIVACIIDLPELNNNLYSFENTDFTVKDILEVQELPTSEVQLDLNYYGIDIRKIDSPSDNFTLKVETPRDPYGLGVISIIEDANGLNITKNMVFDERDTILYHLSGEDIEYAYIVTTIMKETPTAPLAWVPPPSVQLNFSILDGHLSHQVPTETSDFSLGGTISFLMALCIYSHIFKKKKIILKV